MNLYLGVNSDNTCIISKIPIKRFFDEDTNKEDIFSFKDTKLPPHWIGDYKKANINPGKWGHYPIDEYLTLPEGSIKKMFNIDINWNDESKMIEI